MPKQKLSISFKPATLFEGIEWYVGYYVLNPITERLDRKKVKLNHIKSITERRKYAKVVITQLNEKLYSGWNPYLEESAPKGFTKLSDAMDIFYRYKERELRDDSLRSYRSYIKMLKSWLETRSQKDIFSVNFNTSMAILFMNEMYNGKNLSNKTFNNYKIFYVNFWNWMKDNEYVAVNVFSGIKKKKEGQKERIMFIQQEIREQVREYLETTDYNFMVCCMLVFHALLRPKEISWLKPSSFILSEQVIKVIAPASKNGHDRVATIPDSLMPYLVQWNFNNAPNDDYIFSNGMQPGKKPVDAREWTRKWSALRKELSIQDTMKLYSLRDTGIIQLLRDGVSPEEVMRHADHSSLEVTSVYVKYAKPSGSDQIKRKGTAF